MKGGASRNVGRAPTPPQQGRGKPLRRPFRHPSGRNGSYRFRPPGRASLLPHAQDRRPLFEPSHENCASHRQVDPHRGIPAGDVFQTLAVHSARHTVPRGVATPPSGERRARRSPQTARSKECSVMSLTRKNLATAKHDARRLVPPGQPSRLSRPPCIARPPRSTRPKPRIPQPAASHPPATCRPTESLSPPCA